MFASHIHTFCVVKPFAGALHLCKHTSCVIAAAAAAAAGSIFCAGVFHDRLALHVCCKHTPAVTTAAAGGIAVLLSSGTGWPCACGTWATLQYVTFVAWDWHSLLQHSLPVQMCVGAICRRLHLNKQNPARNASFRSRWCSVTFQLSSCWLDGRCPGSAVAQLTGSAQM